MFALHLSLSRVGCTDGIHIQLIIDAGDTIPAKLASGLGLRVVKLECLRELVFIGYREAPLDFLCIWAHRQAILLRETVKDVDIEDAFFYYVTGLQAGIDFNRNSHRANFVVFDVVELQESTGNRSVGLEHITLAAICVGGAGFIGYCATVTNLWFHREGLELDVHRGA